MENPELQRRIETDKGVIAKGIRLKLIDVTLSNDFVAFGEVRVDNFSGVFDGKFNTGDEIKIFAQIQFDGSTDTPLIWTGEIERVEENTNIILFLRGFGARLTRKKFKRSFRGVNASQIINDILSGVGIEFEIGKLPSRRFHSYQAANGTVVDEINRVNESLDLGFTPFINREGKLFLKSDDELITETEVAFDEGEFKKFEQNTLETLLDPQIEVYHIITVLEIKYLVNGHRVLINDQQTKSFLTLEAA